MNEISLKPLEQRREPRRPGRGNVRVGWKDPLPRQIEGRLMDVSASGFRMAHQCADLMPGAYVHFTHFEAEGRARVVWTRINAGTIESGFVVT
jgi:hypothetical protein